MASCLNLLAQMHPRLKPYLFAANGAINPFINIYVNDVDIRSLQSGDTPLTGEDEMTLLLSLAGG